MPLTPLNENQSTLNTASSETDGASDTEGEDTVTTEPDSDATTNERTHVTDGGQAKSVAESEQKSVLSGDAGVDSFDPLGEVETPEVRDRLVSAFEAQPATQLERPSFQGCGVYALYYHGDLPMYEAVSNPPHRQKTPIYVGKASPPGSRKGNVEIDYDVHKLANRISDHHESIQEVMNLQTSEFTYSYLKLEEPWIRFAERTLIQKYSPWWNCYMDGFGNHDVGKNREGTEQSVWDTFHPGRSYVKKRGLVPRGPPREVWRTEVSSQISEDGVYDVVSFPGLEVSPYDPRDTAHQSTGIHEFYD